MSFTRRVTRAMARAQQEQDADNAAAAAAAAEPASAKQASNIPPPNPPPTGRPAAGGSDPSKPTDKAPKTPKNPRSNLPGTGASKPTGGAAKAPKNSRNNPLSSLPTNPPTNPPTSPPAVGPGKTTGEAAPIQSRWPWATKNVPKEGPQASNDVSNKGNDGKATKGNANKKKRPRSDSGEKSPREGRERNRGAFSSSSERTIKRSKARSGKRAKRNRDEFSSSEDATTSADNGSKSDSESTDSIGESQLYGDGDDGDNDQDEGEGDAPSVFLTDLRSLKWVNDNHVIHEGAEMRSTPPTARELMGTWRWVWQTGHGQIRAGDDYGGIAFRHYGREPFSNLDALRGRMRYDPLLTSTDECRWSFRGGTHIAGAMAVDIDMSVDPDKNAYPDRQNVPAYLRFTVQPGLRDRNGNAFPGRANPHRHLLCVRYVDPEHGPVELFAIAQTTLNEDDGDRGFPSTGPGRPNETTEDENPSFGTEGAQDGLLWEFGVGCAEGVPLWNNWLGWKGRQKGWFAQTKEWSFL